LEATFNAFRASFVLGNAELLCSLYAAAGKERAEVKRHRGTVRFALIESLISTERACVWTLGGHLETRGSSGYFSRPSGHLYPSYRGRRHRFRHAGARHHGIQGLTLGPISSYSAVRAAIG
jgi:hypothetical protein